MSNTLTILHPGIEAASDAAPKLAARVTSLKGKRVALLDNGKVNAGVILAAVAERLKAKGIGEVQTWKKQHASQGGDAVFPALFAWKPDLALTGLGD